MKRVLGSVLVATVVMLGIAGTAGASTPNVSVNGVNYYSVGPFQFGPNASTQWSCNGVHVSFSNGAAIELQSCLITGDTTGIVPGSYRSNPSLGLGTTSGCPNAAIGVVPGFYGGGPTCWSSDYNGAFASQWSQTFIPNRNGTFTFFLVASYGT